MCAATSLNGDQARGLVGKVFSYRSSPDLQIADLASPHVHCVNLEHMLGNIKPNNLQAIHGADDLSGVHSCTTIHGGSSMVFVKTVVYHALGTLMPYPSEDPPRLSGLSS
jgi:hypothetical protein